MKPNFKAMKTIVHFILIFFFFSQQLFAQCDGKRYLNKTFDRVKTTMAIDYGGTKKAPDGSLTILDYDLYEPIGDTAQLRPVVILIHGGAFFNLPIVTKKSPDIVELATDLAQRGYVAVSPEYRLLRNPLSLLDDKSMVQIVTASIFDINNLICHLVDSYHNGNPNRIDINKFFVGGVSAGAVLALQGLYLDRKEQLGEPFLTYAEEVAEMDGIDITEDVLNKKFCGAKILGGLSISGALLDTAWITPKSTGILFIHGTRDPVIPYGYDYPFHLPNLPKLAGPKIIYDIIKRTGTPVEQDIYGGAGHVPILTLSLEELFDNHPQDFIFDIQKMDSTKTHTANFFYKMMGCELPVVGISQHTNYGNLNMYPNPNTGKFYIDLPNELKGNNGYYQIIDLLGKVVFSDYFELNQTRLFVDTKLSVGMYTILIDGNDTNLNYTGKILVSQ